MTDRSWTIVATTAGAMIGAAVGYMLFTERGRSSRRRLEAELDDFARELKHFRRTVQTIAGAATEGWNLLNDTLVEHVPSPRDAEPHQRPHSEVM